MDSLVIVFAKLPAPGRVKTRLAATIGDDAAVVAYRRLAEETLRLVPETAELWVAYAPGTPDAEVAMRDWLGAVREVSEWLPQVEGGLGERLEAACREGFRAGARRVTLIGTDCITFTPEIWRITERDERVAFVPANDGGYVLVSLGSEDATAIFHGIRWSAPETLADSVAAGKSADLSVFISEDILSDVDTEDEWICAAEILDSRGNAA